MRAATENRRSRSRLGSPAVGGGQHTGRASAARRWRPAAPGRTGCASGRIPATEGLVRPVWLCGCGLRGERSDRAVAPSQGSARGWNWCRTWSVAHDDPCARWPVRQVDQTGDLSRPGPVVNPAVAVVGRSPGIVRDKSIAARWSRSGRNRPSTTVPSARDVVEEVAAGADCVGANQDLPADSISMIAGSCAIAWARTVMWSPGLVGLGVTGPQRHCQGFPGPVATVVDECAQRVKLVPHLYVEAADSLSECAVTRVTSRSMVNGSAASMSWPGAHCPAATHAAARAEAICLADLAIPCEQPRAFARVASDLTMPRLITTSLPVSRHRGIAESCPDHRWPAVHAPAPTLPTARESIWRPVWCGPRQAH